MNLYCIHLAAWYMTAVAIGLVQADGSSEETALSSSSDESREVEASLYRLRCLSEKHHGTTCRHRLRSSSERFYYSAFQRRCKRFRYAGCGGNANNFVTREECENLCSRPSDSCTESSVDHNTTDFAKDCLSHPDPGRRCAADSKVFVRVSFYYNATTNSCEPFEFLGCDGNNNQHRTLRICEEKCIMHPASQGDKKNSPPDSGEDLLCRAPPDGGFYCSKDMNQIGVSRFYYNETLGICTDFAYKGCGGNSNKYHTIGECEDSCRKLLRDPSGSGKNNCPCNPTSKPSTEDLDGGSGGDSTQRGDDKETEDGPTSSPGTTPTDVSENGSGSTNGSQDFPSRPLPPPPTQTNTSDHEGGTRSPEDDYPNDDTSQPRETGRPQTLAQTKDNTTDPMPEEPTPGTNGPHGHPNSTPKQPTDLEEPRDPTDDLESPGNNSRKPNNSKETTSPTDDDLSGKKNASEPGPPEEDPGKHNSTETENAPTSSPDLTHPVDSEVSGKGNGTETAPPEAPTVPSDDQESPGNNSSDSKNSSETQRPTDDDKSGKKNGSEPVPPEGDLHKPNSTEIEDGPPSSPESTSPSDTEPSGERNASDSAPPGGHPQEPNSTKDADAPTSSPESTRPTDNEQLGKGNASEPAPSEDPRPDPDGEDHSEPTAKEPTNSKESTSPSKPESPDGGNENEPVTPEEPAPAPDGKNHSESSETESPGSGESPSPTSAEQPTQSNSSEVTTQGGTANATSDETSPSTPDSSKNITTAAPTTQGPGSEVTPEKPGILPAPEERVPVLTRHSFAKFCLVYPWNGHPCSIIDYHNGYYYDADLQTCRVIYYNGCDTSNNYYYTLQACIKFCENHPERVRDDNYKYNFEYGKNDQCMAPLDQGMYCISKHNETEQRYHYNHTTRTCEPFVYGGCGGNANKFRTEEECHRVCDIYTYGPNDKYEDRLETTFGKTRSLY